MPNRILRDEIKAQTFEIIDDVVLGKVPSGAGGVVIVVEESELKDLRAEASKAEEDDEASDDTEDEIEDEDDEDDDDEDDEDNNEDEDGDMSPSSPLQ